MEDVNDSSTWDAFDVWRWKGEGSPSVAITHTGGPTSVYDHRLAPARREYHRGPDPGRPDMSRR
jgi:hypothetical protein